ncbi:MAG: hypothetical protein M1823_005835 [Watsoniomyces obsoletus]|nr:MAG: hypothetical protein M1823_005835 [Watsoniomyces obsoletus]
MPGAIVGPPIGFHGLRQHGLFQSPLMSPHHRRLDVKTDDGVVRLNASTVEKFLPNLFRNIIENRIEYGSYHGHPMLHTHRLDLPKGFVMQECLSQLFKHLRELERTDGAAGTLVDWLQRKLSRSTYSHRRHGSLCRVTEYFKKLGKALGRRELGCHRRLFSCMSSFLIKNCQNIFKLVGPEEFLQFVYALDRQGWDMNETLDNVLSSIRSYGRQRLRAVCRRHGSVYSRLQPLTRRAMHKIFEAKGHRDHHHHHHDHHLHDRQLMIPGAVPRAVVPWRGQPVPKNVGIIPRHRRHELIRKFGNENVILQDRLPRGFNFFQVVRRRSHRPFNRGMFRHHLGPRRHSLPAYDDVSSSSGFESDTSSAMTDLYDYDDEEEDDEYELGYGMMGGHHGGHHHHGHIPRRVSYSSLGARFRHGLDSDYPDFDLGFSSDAVDDYDEFSVDPLHHPVLHPHHFHPRSASFARFSMNPNI